jgi:hypothetical protein
MGNSLFFIPSGYPNALLRKDRGGCRLPQLLITALDFIKIATSLIFIHLTSTKLVNHSMGNTLFYYHPDIRTPYCVKIVEVAPVKLVIHSMGKSLTFISSGYPNVLLCKDRGGCMEYPNPLLCKVYGGCSGRCSQRY